MSEQQEQVPSVEELVRMLKEWPSLTAKAKENAALRLRLLQQQQQINQLRLMNDDLHSQLRKAKRSQYKFW